MEQNIRIRCKNNKKIKNIPTGSSLLEIYKAFNLDIPYGPVSAKVNNKAEGLSFRVYRNKDIEFLNIQSASGMRTYVRSLGFVLAKAVEDLYKNGDIVLEHPVSKGYFCHLDIGRETGLDDVARIKKRMEELIEADLPFETHEEPTEEVAAMFDKKGWHDTAKLLRTSGKVYSQYHKLGESVDFYYGSLLPSTGFIKHYDIIKYYDGLLLRVPCYNDPTKLEDVVKQEKMLEVFREYRHWNKIMGTATVGDFNMACLDGRAMNLIKVSEALQEKKISNIADEIYRRKQEGQPLKLVLISGPSSSGKTTFSKRLSVQLMANGIKPLPLSLDNYFVDREKTPLDENGEYDFESLYSLDLDFFNKQMNTLLDGGEIDVPKFNFQTGHREFTGRRLRLEDDQLLLLEGIHGLNPELTSHIADEKKFKIYVSALTTILLDSHNYIPTTDNRLLRRIIRDYKYRDYSAVETIKRWPSVRAGEDKWIFPFQENADAMFNSALLFEIAVLKDYALPILRKVPQNCPEYSEAYRLLKFLSYILSIPSAEVPSTSLLREFLGGSSFKY